MGQGDAPANLQEAVDRSFQAQWGGKRFCLITAIVLLVLAVISGIVLALARNWFEGASAALNAAEISALVTSFVCLIASVMFALESLIRLQRERGQTPDRVIHAALCLSAVAVAGLLFLFFLSLESGAMRPGLNRIIKFIVFLFSGLVWLGSVVMNSAAITIIVSRRSELLEVNNTNQGTSLLFRRGHSMEIVKLSIAALIPLIIFVIALLMAGGTYIL